MKPIAHAKLKCVKANPERSRGASLTDLALGPQSSYMRSAQCRWGEEFFIEEKRLATGARLLLWARLKSDPTGAGFHLSARYQLQTQQPGKARVYDVEPSVAARALASGKSAINEILKALPALSRAAQEEFGALASAFESAEIAREMGWEESLSASPALPARAWAGAAIEEDDEGQEWATPGLYWSSPKAGA